MESWMKAERKISEVSTKTREVMLDATETIMREEGYAAVTSRRVAERAGLKSQLVYYHFGTMDDLFVAVYERSEQEFFERELQALTSSTPLRALWELSIHPKRTALAMEMIALSNHRKAIRKLIARSLEQMHRMQIAAITKYLGDAGLDSEEYPPVILSYIISGVARSLVTEAAMGVTTRHPELLAFAEGRLRALETKGSARGSAAPD
jgi:TetR/AcrR family transcriptional regulator of autoinduction and epiphytic fitness